MKHGVHKFLLFHVLACLGPNVPGSKIINGKKAGVNSMMYMASVQDDRKHECGGFLIKDDWVVTAASCDTLERPTVALGTTDLRNIRKSVKFIEKKCKHPNYNENGSNDIMLLKVAGTDRFNIKLDKIGLPTSEMNIKGNEECHVAGWGSTKAGGKSVDELMVVDVSVINQQRCEDQLSTLPDNVICAGGQGGICEGDAGGPLVCNNTAVGVATLSKGGNCDPGTPNIYTDISKFLPWIKEVLTKGGC